MRVQVPEEIWAGESRPLFAVLNGPYNDGVESKAGDIPWTYEIEWQFAEPVWEEKVEEGETVYEPRPPETEDEFVPSTILTGGHRIKHDTSPLYLGDMTSSAGGLAYVRAVIKDVNIDTGEVVQGTGTTDVVSVWVLTRCKVEMQLVSLDGRETNSFSVYCDWTSPDGGTPIVVLADEIESLSVTLDAPLLPDVVDTVSVELNEETYVLDETDIDSEVFQSTDPPPTLTLAVDEMSELTGDAHDVARVTVSCAALGIDNRTMVLVETTQGSGCLRAQRGALAVGFSNDLSPSTVDLAGVTVFDAVYSGESRVLLTESDPSSRVFIDLTGFSGFRVTLVEAPLTFDVETADTILCCVSRNDSSEWDDWYIRLNETGPNTMFFMSAFQTGTEDPGEPDDSIAQGAVNRLVVKHFPSVYGTTADYRAVTEAGVYDFPVVSRGVDCISGGLILCAVAAESTAQIELPPGLELKEMETGELKAPVIVTTGRPLEAFEQVVKRTDEGFVIDTTLLQHIADIERWKDDWAIELYDKLGSVVHEVGFFTHECRDNALWVFDNWELEYFGMMGYIPHTNHGATAASFVWDLARANRIVRREPKSVALPIGILLVHTHGLGGRLEFPWLEARADEGGNGWGLWGVSQYIGPYSFVNADLPKRYHMSKVMKNQHPQLVFLCACQSGKMAADWRDVTNADVFVGWSDSCMFLRHHMGFGNDVLRLSWRNMYLDEAERLSISEIVERANERLERTYDLPDGVDPQKEDPYCVCLRFWGRRLPDGTREKRERGTYPEPVLVIDTAEGAEDLILKTYVDLGAEPSYDYEPYLEQNPTPEQWLNWVEQR